MKIHRSTNFIHIDLTVSEARALLDELENVRGGARLPKLRQVCASLEASISITPTPVKIGRPKTAFNSQRSTPFEIDTTALSASLATEVEHEEYE